MGTRRRVAPWRVASAAGTVLERRKSARSRSAGVAEGVEAHGGVAGAVGGIGQELKLAVIAEGVETREHVEFLKRNDCDLVQGFYYSRPLAKNDFLVFVEKQDFHTQRRKALEIV